MKSSSLETEEKPQGCLLIGCPRSGTFLLMAILEQCFDMATPLETHFIPYFERYKYLWGDLSRREARARMLDAIYDFLDIWTPRMIVNGDMALAHRFSLASTSEKYEEILDHSVDYSSIVQAMMAVYCEQHGKSDWVEKSAFFKHINMSFADLVLPQARILHIVRDGRDCALSWMNTWAKPGTLEEAASLWGEHVREKSKWVEQNQSRALEVRYEDLIRSPHTVLSEIGIFLGKEPINLDPDLTDSAYAEVLSRLSSHKMVAGRIRSGNSQKYKEIMALQEQEAFSSIAGNMLNHFGYSQNVNPVEPSPARKISVILRGFFGSNAYRRMMKANLPLFIRVAQLFGMRLSLLINRTGTARDWKNRI
jgi:hypothetical protein